MNADDPRKLIRSYLQQDDAQSLLIHAAGLHGHYCPDLAFGVMAGMAGLNKLGFENVGMEELVAIVECNNCFVDGIQTTTGCSFGNNALIYKDLGKTAVSLLSRKTNSAVRIVLKPNSWNSDKSSEKEKEAGYLFQRVVRQRQNDPEAAKRMHALFKELSFETLDKPPEALLDIHEIPANFPSYAPIFDSVLCSICSEQFMETRAAVRDGRLVCLACAQQDSLAVLGRGISVLPQGQLR